MYSDPARPESGNQDALPFVVNLLGGTQFDKAPSKIVRPPTNMDPST